MSDLRTAAQQALEYLGASSAKLWPAGTRYRIVAALHAALAQQAEPKGGGRLPPPLQAEPVQEPDLFHCPKCGGPADNGHDRSIPPNPYFCTRCMAEPVHKCPNCASLEAQNTELDRKLAELEQAEPKPLTEEEIYKIYNELWRSTEVVEFARAIERAHEIGGQP